MPGTGNSSASPGPAWLNRFRGFFARRMVTVDQNTFFVIVIDEANLTGNIALPHNYDTAFIAEQ
jgi:hypothetical protein